METAQTATTAMAEAPTRLLKLEGTYNVRDTGGYATTDGGTIRWRTLLRGDSLHRLTAAGQATLVDAGLRTVVDLRRDTELAQEPNVFATADAVRYVNISLIESTPHEAEAATLRTLTTIYEGIIAASHARIREIFAALAEPAAFPALVHCTAGKDRTGIIIALLLGVAGVPTETIVADYALTEQFLAGEWVAERKRIITANGGDWAAMEPLMGSPAQLMRQTLADIEIQYGGIPQYLCSIGVPDATLDTLRAALVEAPADAHGRATATPPTMTTFVHLTDTHIQPTETDSFFGLDTLARLHETLTLLRERGMLPGATILISGDLANNGEPESYARLRAVVEELRAEGSVVHLALGNHDNRAAFRTAMLDEPTSDGTAKYHYTAMIGGLRVIVLDSHEPGTHHGALGDAQLAWLIAELATPAPEGTVIAVHHPPTDAPVPALAGHLLGDADALRDVIAGTDVIGVLAGHTHVSAVEQFGGVPSVTAPGTAFLLDVTAQEGMRFLDGGGVNIVTVRNGVMTAAPLALPRSQREVYHHHPGDPVANLKAASATAETDATDAADIT